MSNIEPVHTDKTLDDVAHQLGELRCLIYDVHGTLECVSQASEGHEDIRGGVNCASRALWAIAAALEKIEIEANKAATPG